MHLIYSVKCRESARTATKTRGKLVGHIHVPRVVGRIRRKHPVEVEDLNFLKRHTKKRVKITVPRPFTMSQQAQNDFYKSEEEAAMDYAAAVNEEIRDLFKAGAERIGESIRGCARHIP